MTTIRDIASWSCATGTIQLWHPDFRTLPIDKIEILINADVEWHPYGFHTFELCRDNATVYVSK